MVAMAAEPTTLNWVAFYSIGGEFVRVGGNGLSQLHSVLGPQSGRPED
jgi:hypothetical protein